jgi:outer membrane lipoprotein SlyB
MKRPTITWKLIHRIVIAVGTAALVASCAATQTVLEHRSLDTQTALSKTIFLEPVSLEKKTIYLSVKNTSDKTLDIAPALKNALINQGYRVVSKPEHAHYLLQANMLNVGKMSVTASQRALGGGYGSALAGGVSGAALGALSGDSTRLLVGGVAGGFAGMAADALVKDINYTMVTDIQISERLDVHQQRDYQRYRTRVVSHAARVNLSFNTARPALEAGLVKTLAGIF